MRLRTCVWSNSSNSQNPSNVVRGLVVAAADGSVLAAATITLKADSSGERLRSQTDADGRFAFPLVRPGAYVLSISSAGFVAHELRFMLEPREARTMTVSLEVARVAERVDVSSNASSVPGTHSPSSTTLTIDRLNSIPVFQRTSLSDAIVTLAPGMIRGHDDFVHRAAGVPFHRHEIDRRAQASCDG